MDFNLLVFRFNLKGQLRLSLQLLLLCSIVYSCQIQSLSLGAYVGPWEGRLQEKNPFLFNIELVKGTRLSLSVCTAVPGKAWRFLYFGDSVWFANRGSATQPKEIDLEFRFLQEKTRCM